MYMIYFEDDYLNFFKELAANNNKQWFDLNRKRYEDRVREPFKSFVGDLIQEVQRYDPEVRIEPKDAIFRINRDIRFSKDKTPYKLFHSAIISQKGRKDKSFPGMYIELSPENLKIVGGVYQPDTRQIQSIREHIAKNSTQFVKLIGNADFKETFGAVRGEQNKRIPKEFRDLAEKLPLIANKQWYYFSELPPQQILQDDLLEVVVRHFKTMLPVNRFFEAAIT